MRKLLTNFEGGHDLRLDDWEFLQQAYSELINEIMESDFLKVGVANPNNPFVLRGVVQTGNSFTAGSIFWNGEIYLVNPITILGSGTLYWELDISYNPNFVLYQDFQTRQVHQIRRLKPTYINPGPLNGFPNSVLQRYINPFTALQNEVNSLNANKVGKDDNSVMGSNLSFNNSYKVTDLANGTNPRDAVNKQQLDTKADLSVALSKLPKDGSEPMLANLNMNNNKIVNVSTPTVSTDAATKGYVDSGDAAKVSKAGDIMTGNLNMNTKKIINLGTPTDNNDAATKSYVDSGVATKVSKSGDTMTGDLTVSGIIHARNGTSDGSVGITMGASSLTRRKIINLHPGTDANDAINKGQLDNALGTQVTSTISAATSNNGSSVSINARRFGKVVNLSGTFITNLNPSASAGGRVAIINPGSNDNIRPATTQYAMVRDTTNGLYARVRIDTNGDILLIDSTFGTSRVFEFSVTYLAS